MSEISEKERTAHADTVSEQSVNVRGASSTTQNQQQQQQRSASPAERAGRSEHRERGDRQRIQRSSSSTSSSSSSPAHNVRGAARAEAPVGTGAQQQYSAESGFAYGTTAGVSQGASGASFASGVSGERRQGRHRKEVIRLPDQQQPQVRQVRRRLPTPEPDTLERVYLQRTGGEVVEEITEIPTTPPPIVQERTVVEPAGPPQIVKRVIRVPPRGGAYGGYQQQQQTQQQQQGVGAFGGYQQQQQQPQGAGFQGSSNFVGAGNYGNIQQAASAYQQQAGTSYPGGFSGAATAGSGFGSVGGGFQPQQGFSFTVGGAGAGGFSSPSVLPPAGCHPAFCFYV